MGQQTLQSGMRQNPPPPTIKLSPNRADGPTIPILLSHDAPPLKALPSHGRGRMFNPCRAHQPSLAKRARLPPLNDRIAPYQRYRCLRLALGISSPFIGGRPAPARLRMRSALGISARAARSAI